MATEIRDRIAPYSVHRVPCSPLVGLQARLSMLRAAMDDFDREWRRFLETPFDIAPHPAGDDSLDYAADEDVWGGHDGEPS